MDSNLSIYMTLLTMEPLDISPSNVLPVFILGTLTYSAILCFNMTLLLTIALKPKLHKPMYLLLFNLPINDMMGASAFFPQMLSNVLSQNRFVSYPSCFVQAFLTHLYGAGSLLILTAMAYDRYIAICCPLQYNSLMSQNNLSKIITAVWTLDFTLISALLLMSYRKEVCSTKIVDLYCNNPSLMKLICGDMRLNNYYGLSITIFLQGFSLLIVLLTYIKILTACISSKQSAAKNKAVQTCGTHLVVFLCVEFNALFALIAHRFENVSQHLRQALGVSVMIFPPFINPLVYGLKTKEIRQCTLNFFHKKISVT